MHRNTFGTQRPGGAIANAFDLQLKNPANTNVIEWGGRLLSLWEVRVRSGFRVQDLGFGHSTTACHVDCRGAQGN